MQTLERKQMDRLEVVEIELNKLRIIAEECHIKIIFPILNQAYKYIQSAKFSKVRTIRNNYISHALHEIWFARGMVRARTMHYRVTK